MRAQPHFGLRQIVRDQGCRRLHQTRILVGGLEVVRPRVIGAARIARQVQLIRQQAPGVCRVVLQLQRPPQRGDGLLRAPRFAAGDGELQMRGRQSGLLQGERLEHLERTLRTSGNAVCSAQDQPRVRMSRDGFEDFVHLLDRECGILLQQSRSMPQRNVQCSDGLRSAVQMNIQSIPVNCYELI